MNTLDYLYYMLSCILKLHDVLLLRDLLLLLKVTHHTNTY